MGAGHIERGGLVVGQVAEPLAGGGHVLVASAGDVHDHHGLVIALGLQIGGLLSGSVITENIFSIPGMGRLLVDSISFRDYPVIQGLLMIFALQYVLINLVVDVLYGVINPKIRLD